MAAPLCSIMRLVLAVPSCSTDVLHVACYSRTSSKGKKKYSIVQHVLEVTAHAMAGRKPRPAKHCSRNGIPYYECLLSLE